MLVTLRRKVLIERHLISVDCLDGYRRGTSTVQKSLHVSTTGGPLLPPLAI
jgi:hypothetical protein